jgi:hypothetical protein
LMAGSIPNSPRGSENRLDAFRGIGRLKKAILNACEQAIGARLMTHADERPCVRIQGCLNRAQIENPCVRVVNYGFMIDEGVIANAKYHGSVRVRPFCRNADAHGVGIGIRFRYYNPQMLSVGSSLRNQKSIATGEQRSAPVS